MKTMKKFWIIFCSFVFALALGLGITLQPNVKAKAATSTDVNITYACVEYSAKDGTGVPTTYTFVAGLTTSSAYNTHVYVDGQKTAATVNWGNLYIDHSAFACEVGDTFLLEIPAGTYYQTDATVASDVKLFMTLTNSYTDPNSGAYNKQGILTITDASNVISQDAYAVQLNRKDWAMNASNAGALYLTIVDPENTIKSGVASEDWANGAQYAPLGNAVTVNGVALNKKIQKVYADPSQDAYMQVANVSKAGDVLTFDGWFYNATHGAFRVEKTSFIFDGKSWEEENAGSYDLEASTTSDSKPQNGFYLSMALNHIPVSTDNSGWTYRTVPVGANHYGYYNGAEKAIKLAKFSATDWYVSLNESGITAVAGDTVSFGGWYMCTDASSVKHFIKLNPKSYQFDGTKWTETTPTISVSLNESELKSSVLYVAPGQLASDVTATASNGGTVAINFGEAVSGDKFVLRSGESTSDYLATFSVTDGDGMIYTKKLAVRVGFEDFSMENGAAVRVVGDDVNGLRFSAEISADTYNSLQAQGATFGMVIVPRDYITDGYELTAANLFGAGAKYSATAAAGANQAVRRMLLLDNLTPSDRDKDGNYEIYGSITDILTNNLTREFVGVAYVCVNGEYILASYYGNDMENNARSIYYVAQKAIDADDNVDAVQEKYIDTFNAYVADAGKTYNVSYTVNYIRTRKGVTEIETETQKAQLNSVVEITAKEYDGFSLISGVSSVMLKLYANKENVFDFYYKDLSMPDLETVAWHHPKLDATNNYMNDTNKAIAETMRDAGFTGVLLNGSAAVGDLDLNSAANIEVMKNIINMFWTYGGIQTIVSSKNSGDTGVALENYESLSAAMATLVDCEGFGGFFGWDEPLPTNANLNKVAEYAEFFDSLYGDEATFMTNLFPSYYADWSKGDYTSYSAYIQAYCDIVLPKIVNGTKYLSMDSYPVNADGTLEQSFMYDMAVLKHYALEYGAQANAILQACGWDSDTHNVVPTEAQYRMMYYTALAFGMDSIGWWGYSPETDAENSTILQDQTPVDINNNTTAAYDALKAVNNEIAAFGPIYKTYDWQGVIMSSPSAGFIGIGKDAQYDAFNKVKSDSLLSKYMLSAGNTASFSSISGSGSNYVVSVMKDNNNNEAFTVVNYSAPKDNKTLSITFKANADGKYFIYQGGEQQEVTITTSGYTLTLAPGEGAFIMSANTTHTVTFENWDGTVLDETTCQIGNTPVYGGAEPTRDGYAFAGWTPTLGAITGDTVYTATFKKLPFIIFKLREEDGGEILQQGTWNFGETPVYIGETPRLDNDSQFVGWSPEIVPATGDAVYTAVFNKVYLVTYTNYDGTEDEYEEEVTGGKTIADAPTPSLDGYIFKGWVDGDGVPFDTTTPISSDLYLVATWYKEMENGEKSVYTAEDVASGAQSNVFTQVSVAKEAGWDWYYDTDYLFSPAGNNIDENRLWNRAQFTANATNVGDNVITLPKINFAMYSKVDFGFVSSIDTSKGNITDVQLNGVSGVGFENRLIHIAPDANGKYYATVYKVNESTVLLKVELSDAVVNGEEALTFNVITDGAAYAWVKITELHMRSRVNDYTLNIEEALATLESNPEDTDALNAYFENVAYMTEYERANYGGTPDIVFESQEAVNYKAVVNAEAGSEEQAAAINSYKNFLARYPKTRNEEHIAVINAIIMQNFYELEEEEQVLVNDPVVDTSNGAKDDGDRIATGWGGHNTNYNTSYTQHVHMINFNSDPRDGVITLPAINYTQYAEAYFGMFAIAADSGTITIGDGSKTFDASKGHNWKVTIVGNVLTVTDDSTGNNDGGGVIFTTTISDSVLKGETGLVIDCQFTAYAKVEITEMHVTAFKTNEQVLLNDPTVDTTRGAVDQNERIQTGWGGQHTDYNTTYETYVHMIQFTSGDYDSTVTLPVINFNEYDEVYFGLFAIASKNGTVTIAGQSFSFDASKGHSWKVTVKDGVLTMKDDSKGNNDGGGVIFTATLSDDVANGKAGLTIEYNFDAWAQAEITEMHTISRVRKTFSAVLDNKATIAVSGSSISTQNYQPYTYWGTSIKTEFSTSSYTKYNLAQFAAADSAYNATFTLPTFDFTKYSETYFGIASVTAAGEATVTIAGASYTFDLNDGYVYVKVVVKGDTLTIIGDGAKNVGQVLATATLSEEILSGKQALVVNWSTAGWSQFELSEIQTNSWVEEIK